MPDVNLLVMLLPLILCAYTVQTMMGFGGAIIALAIGANFTSVDLIVGSMLPVSLLLYGTLMIKHYRHLQAKTLLMQVLPMVFVGFALGLLLLPYMNQGALKLVFALLVVLFAGREIWLLTRNGSKHGRNMGRMQASILQVAAGVVHVLFTTGGPPLVYSLSRMGMDKDAFRVSMCALWLPLNLVLAVAFVINGRINPETLKITACFLPVLPLGVFLGERLHKMVSGYIFKLLVYGLLLVSGLIMALKQTL